MWKEWRVYHSRIFEHTIVQKEVYIEYVQTINIINNLIQKFYYQSFILNIRQINDLHTNYTFIIIIKSTRKPW